MADLFRKTSLEKLSSPEQLDKMIVITPLSFWIAMLGGVLMIVSALVWSIFGRLPVNVETQGIYVNSGGTYSVYSELSGIVEKIAINRNETVREGDTLVYLNSEDIQKKIDEYTQRIEMVEAITMDTEGDIVTADNSNLVEVKNQMLTIDETLHQSRAMLELYTKNVALKRIEVNNAEKEMQAAEAAYYSSLNVGDSTSEQLAYTEAQGALANASAYLETAYGSLDQAQVAYTQAEGQYQNALDKYNNLLTEEAALKEVMDSKEDDVENIYQTRLALHTDPMVTIAPLDLLALLSGVAVNNYGSYPWASDIEWKNTVDSYASAVEKYINYVNSHADTKEQLLAYVEQYKLEKDAAEAAKNNYRNDVNSYTEQKQGAQTTYDAAKDTYMNRIEALNGAQSKATALSNAYSVALSKYNNESATLTSLISSMEQMVVQAESEKVVLERKRETVFRQFVAMKASVIDQLTRECEQYVLQKEQCIIRATVSGVISDIAVVQGSAVNQGSEIVKVAQESADDNVVVCYVPLNSGKKIVEDMKVLIYPTTVNKQEYGHMEATVLEVDNYVTSTETLRTQLGNDNLVESFLQEGPVVAVVCKLRSDENTLSGYYWSSKKGASLSMEEGTLVEASVVIEEKAPISMLIPYIKEKLTMQTQK